MTHPRHGLYSEHLGEPGVVDLERIASHPAAQRGEFFVENGRIKHTELPDFDLDSPPDRALLVDLANLGRSVVQETEDEEPADVR
jgi:hypothetical protein